MPVPNSLRDAGLNVNIPLSNIAQGVVQPQFVMRALFPFVEVGTYDGQIVRFDDSAYEEVDDTRADDAPYPEVQDGYSGRAYQLETRGFSYRVGQKKARRMQNLRINWGRRAQNKMMVRAGLKHEIESAVIATNPASYAATNRVQLTAGNQFSDPNVNPGEVIRQGKSVIAGQIGVDPNVLVLGRVPYDALQENEQIKDRIKYTSRESLTPEMIANFYGFDRVVVCNALRKNRDGTKSRVFGNHCVMAYTNPAALNQDRLPYRINQQIDTETPSFGYTYVFQGNPQAYTPYFDQDRGATVYKLDFDRSVESVGVDDGNLITHAFFIEDAAA